jgi:hypothetical protein
LNSGFIFYKFGLKLKLLPMIKKLLLLAIIFCPAINANAQGEANKWFFGTLAGIDFNGGSPVAISGSVNSAEGSAAISSASGNLMFYTDGMTIYDSTDAPMANGSGLMGDGSTTQTAIIIPSPSSASQYFVFTLAADGGSAGFRYSIVDMTLNGGLGDVTGTKNVAITDSVTEKLCAIEDGSGTGYWITIHKWGSNKFYSYHLTTAGLSAPVISSVGSVHIAGPTAFQNTYGQMKFNMCGNKLALATGYQDFVELFDFDINTGVVSNPMTFPQSHHVYGVEFSKNSGLLYITSYDPSASLIQYNISLGAQALIAASKVPLSASGSLYGLQMGPDGKIYVAQSFGSPFLGAINNPDTYGIGADFSETALLLDPMGNGVMGGLGLPTFLQDFVKINVTCSVGMEEVSRANDAKVFPNPSAGEFNIRFQQNERAQIMIYDHTGRLMESSVAVSGFTFGKEYPSGMYFISCEMEGVRNTYKVIKN